MGQTHINIGDKIITNKKCHIGKDNKIEFENKTGYVYTIVGDLYGIEFEVEESKDLHFLEGQLFKQKGFFLEKDEFKKIDLTKDIEDKGLASFATMIHRLEFESKLKNMTSLDEKKENIKTLERQAKQYTQEAKKYTQSAIKEKKEVKIALNSKIPVFNLDNYQKQYNSVLKSKLIDSITTYKEWLVVNTEELTYHNQNSPIPDYVLGKYKLFLNLNNHVTKAINTTRQLSQGSYFHPCIESGGIICMGQQVKDEIKHFYENGDITGIIFLLLNFFQEPDYGNPYTDEKHFYCAQPVTIADKMEKETDWFESSVWREYEKWNSDKYNDEVAKIIKTLEKKIADGWSPPNAVAISDTPSEDEEQEDNPYPFF